MIATQELTPTQRCHVLALVQEATEHDGVGPLDEEARLALSGDEPSDDVPDGARHLLVPPPQEDDPDGVAVGYVSLLPDGTVQGTVRPDRRGHGVGRALLEAVLDARPDAGIWAHGGLPTSLSFLRGHGLVPVRELLTLSRTLEPGAVPPPQRPAGIETARFDPSRDVDGWLRVNAAAFADHPEQGRWSAQDLRRRMEEPWFDAADLHVAREDGELVGFVWIKRERQDGAQGTPEPAEVYVVGTDPAHAGRGIARTLMGVALHELAADGVDEVELYVEADNTAARHLYESLGFSTSGCDVQFRVAHTPDGPATLPEED
jgi:mycothiol synthase